MRGLGLLIVFVAGCGSPPPETVVAAPAPPDLPEPAPRTVERATHVARFLDEELDECDDIGRTYVIAPGVTWEPPPNPFSAGVASMASTDGPGVRTMELAQSCAAAFAGRVQLASCTYTDEAGAAADHGLDAGPDAAPSGTGVSSTITAGFYRFATALDDDHLMIECLGSHGSWWAVAHDSPEYEDARLRFHAAGALDRADRAQRELDRLRRR
jgi:hypothetical protein